MVEFYLYLFIATCIGLLVWGFQRAERVYQFPFLMGAIFTSFILPQAISLVSKPGPVTQEALERILLFSSLCTSMCWIGYQFKVKTKWIRKISISLNERRLFRSAIVLTLISYLFTYLLLTTEIQVTEEQLWTGRATIYFFFASIIYIPFAIFLLLALKKPTKGRILASLFAGTLALAPVVFAGRRQPTFTVIAIIGITFFYVRNLLPPRLLVMGATFLAAFLIPLVGFLREEFWLALLSGDLYDPELFRYGLDFVLKGDILEFRNATIAMDAASRTHRYGYGTGFWDAIIFQYVPGQIVGYDLKESLQFNLTNYDLETLFGYKNHIGSTLTAIGDSFVEFGYFACLLFGLIAYAYKHIWVSSVYHKSMFSQIFYAGLISPALIGITHGLGTFVQQFIFQLIFISLVGYYSKVRYKVTSRYPINQSKRI